MAVSAMYINVLVSVLKRTTHKMAIFCISNANLVPDLKLPLSLLPLAPPPCVGGGPLPPCYGDPPPRLGGPPRLGELLQQHPFLFLLFPLPLGEGGRVGEGLCDLLPLGSPASSIGYSIVLSLSNIAVK